MSIKLVKQPRRKTYDIRVWLEKYKKIKWINTYQTTEREARKVLRKYQESEIEYKLGLREEQLPTEPIPTLSEAIDKYLDKVMNDPDMSNKTYELHKSVLNNFIEVMGGTITIDCFGVEESDHYEHYLSHTIRKTGAFKGAEGLSENTKNIRKRIVTTLFNWCIRNRKWIHETDFKLSQTNPPKKMKLITPSDYQLILKNEPSEYKRSYYRLGWVCGLRRKEINPSEMYNDDKLGLALLITETKGRDTEERAVPLPDENVEDWMNVKNVQYSLDYITRSFNKACKRVGLYVPYETTFHALRHSYATLKCVEGMHLIQLAEYMGHTSTKTTEKYAKAKRGYFAMLKKEEEGLKYVA